MIRRPPRSTRTDTLFPYTTLFRSLCTLAYVAAKTTKIALGTSVVVLPFRHPMELAKYAATLDQLSGGRVILGVGVGGLIEEFQAMGIPFEQRGAISDETLRIVRKLWTEETVTHHGTRWNFRSEEHTSELQSLM